jgi:NAD-dependent dihydropyrimidine dehydrogenase PreA subunit
MYSVKIEPEECKGCERCVNACPKSVLKMQNKLNFMGYPYAIYIGKGCIGCGACFYNCPEPGAVTVYEETEE